MRLLPYEAEARVCLGESAYKWIMRDFFKYLLDIIIQSEHFLVAWLVFREGRKFNTLVRLCEFDNLIAIYAIPRILVFFPKKDLSAVYADDRVKARKERLQFSYISSMFLLNFSSTGGFFLISVKNWFSHINCSDLVPPCSSLWNFMVVSCQHKQYVLW